MQILRQKKKKQDIFSFSGSASKMNSDSTKIRKLFSKKAKRTETVTYFCERRKIILDIQIKEESMPNNVT